MKKYILVLFLIMFIVPSVAMASWWNPFSWKVFHKKEVTPTVQIEVQKTPEEKINELQKQLDELKNQQPKTIPVTKTQIQNYKPTATETWGELEAKYFVDADQKGHTYLWISNSLGEKRYYRKEGTQWVRKNTEEEASQPYTASSSFDQDYYSRQMLNLELFKTQSQIDKTNSEIDLQRELRNARNSYSPPVDNSINCTSSYLSGRLYTNCN